MGGAAGRAHFICERRQGEAPLILEEMKGEGHQICYMELGNMDVFAERRIVRLAGGEILVLPRDAMVRVTVRSPFKNCWTVMGVSESFLEPFSAACGRETVHGLLSLGHWRVPPERQRETEEILAWLAGWRPDFLRPEETGADKTGHGGQREPAPMPVEEFVRRGRVYEFIGSLGGLMPAEEPKNAPESRERIQTAVDTIWEMYGSPLSAAGLAQQAGMGQPHFSRRFQQFVGASFKEYVMYVRMKEARRLLEETGEPVGEIARRCGFKNSNYFGDVFKHSQGISPMGYRKKKRQQNKTVV